MKTFFLGLVILLSIATVQAQTRTFNTEVKLNKLVDAQQTDSILTINRDNKVSFIPKSVFTDTLFELNTSEDIEIGGGEALIANRDTSNSVLGFYLIRKDFDWSSIPSSMSSAIWEIRYDVDLQGGDIVLPEFVYLKFTGGSLNNYNTIEGKKTNLLGERAIRFDGSGEFTGEWNIKDVFTDWFSPSKNGHLDLSSRTSDNLPLQKALNLVKTAKSNLIVTKGDYFVTNSGNVNEITNPGNRSYSIRLDNTSDIDIVFENGARFIHDQTALDRYNVLDLYKCDRIKIKDMVVFGGLDQYPDSTAGRSLYEGGAILANRCNQILVTGGDVRNMMYFTQFFQSEYCIVNNTVFKYDKLWHDQNGYSSNLIPLSAHILFNSRFCKIKDNMIYGGCGDGDLSIFGGGSWDNSIVNNTMVTYAWDDPEREVVFYSQGITVDQGPRNTLVEGNHISGYFYCIDVKADTVFTQVKNNKLENFVVAIADRKGESTTVDASVATIIQGNTILFREEVGFANSALGNSVFGDLGSVGIWSLDRYGCIIRDNTISVYDSSTDVFQMDKIVGIIIEGKGANEEGDGTYFDRYLIENNIINLSYGKEGTVVYAPAQSRGIRFGGLNGGKISGNRIKMIDSTIYIPFEMVSDCKNMRISENTIYNKPNSAVPNIFNPNDSILEKTLFALNYSQSNTWFIEGDDNEAIGNSNTRDRRDFEQFYKEYFISQLNSSSSPANTTNKYKGKRVMVINADFSFNSWVFASGTSPTSTWVSSDGSPVFNPL